MLVKNDIFRQNNLKLAFEQVTIADIRLVLTFDVTNVITNSINIGVWSPWLESILVPNIITLFINILL